MAVSRESRLAKLSLTTKISILLSLLICFLMITMTVAAYHRSQMLLETQLISQGLSMAQATAALAAEKAATNDTNQLKTVIYNFKTNPDVAFAAISNAYGTYLIHSDESLVGKGVTPPVNQNPKAPAVNRLFNATGQPAGYVFTAPIVTAGGMVVGYFHLGLTNSRWQAVLYQMLTAFFLATLAAIIAGIFLARIIAKRLLHKPIKDLAQATEYIAAGNFTYQVPVHSYDELGQLSLAFNTMNNHLNNLFRSVRSSTAELTRTSQLIASKTEELITEEENLSSKQKAAVNELSTAARRLGRIADKLNSLSMQFKL